MFVFIPKTTIIYAIMPWWRRGFIENMKHGLFRALKNECPMATNSICN